MKWGLWSTTAGSNSATPPDGWPEGQAPSTVNDCAREMMAQIRTGINNIQFVDLGVTPTQTGNTTFTLAGNQMQWYPYGNRVQANVGGTVYTGTVISSTYTTNTGVTLRFDGGLAPLTNSLSAVATGFPSSVNGAVPENVYRRKNALLNGNFNIWQRLGNPNTVISHSVGAITRSLADMWNVSMGIPTAGPVMVQSRTDRSANASNVPTLAQVGVLLQNALCLSCNIAVSVLSATDNVNIAQNIEGYTWGNFAGKPLTLSFWVNSTVTGTYCVSLRNTGANMAYVAQYSINSVATWEKKTINIVKAPQTGTWDYSTGIGAIVTFALGTGSSLQGGAGNWTAANILATSAQTNFMGVASSTFKLAAVQLEEGNQATPLELNYYHDELARCKRYLQPIYNRIYGYAIAANTGLYQGNVSVPMRNASLSCSQVVATSDLVMLNGAASPFSVSAFVQTLSMFENGFTIEYNCAGTPLTTGQGSQLASSAGSQIILFYKSLL